MGCTQGWGRGCSRRRSFHPSPQWFGGAAAARLCPRTGLPAPDSGAPARREGAARSAPRGGSLLRVGSSGQVPGGACGTGVCVCVCTGPRSWAGRGGGEAAPLPASCGSPPVRPERTAAAVRPPAGAPGRRRRRLGSAQAVPGVPCPLQARLGFRGTRRPSGYQGSARGAGAAGGETRQVVVSPNRRASRGGGGLGEGRGGREASAGVRLGGGAGAPWENWGTVSLR